MLVKDGLKIVGVGNYIPPKIVTNDDLSKIVDTNDEWISSRTGIRSRHFVTDERNQDMAIAAAKMALEDAGIDKSLVGAVIVATIRPDNVTPSVACAVQKELGLPCDIPSFDINAACSGFMYGLSIARGLLMQTDKKYAIVVGTEVLSKLLNMEDRGTCILFGDGAGAAVVELSDNKFYSVMGSKGYEDVIRCINSEDERRVITMNGSEVFKFAVTTVPKVLNELIEKAGVTFDDIDSFVLHQANQRIIESVAKKCKQDMSKFFIDLDKYGNTSSASIPIALTEMRHQGLIKPGMKMLCVGFGAGLTWGGVYLEW